MCCNIDAITTAHMPDKFVITHTIQLAVMLNACYGMDTKDGKHWRKLINTANEIKVAKEEYGENWKKVFARRINEADENGKEKWINLLKFLTKPQDTIVVNAQDGKFSVNNWGRE